MRWWEWRGQEFSPYRFCEELKEESGVLVNGGSKGHTSNTPLALSTVRPHLVEGAFSNVYGTQDVGRGQRLHENVPTGCNLTIFFSFSSASVHSPPKDTAYIPSPSAATPTIRLLMNLVLRSIELGESLADRAPVRSERGVSSAAVKSSVERLGSSESVGSETSLGAARGGSGVEGLGLGGSLGGDWDEAAG